jgi:CDP-diacylglycerol--serine O-phosphatidyltransferase
MKIKLFNVPNVLTLFNLLSGCLAIVFVFEMPLHYVAVLTTVSLIADFFDGMSARALNQKSLIGGDLDSLADMVSFGIVPSLIFYQLLLHHYKLETTDSTNLMLRSAPAFLIALFAALRLAKFNVDTRQSDGFIGLATPAVTIFVVGIMLVITQNIQPLAGVFSTPVFLYGSIIVLSYLMIAELPMFSFKGSITSMKGNEWRLSFLIISAVLIAWHTFAAIPLVIILYVLFSIIRKFVSK